MFAHTRRVRLLGTGVATRDNLVTSAEIDARLSLTVGTVEDRTGVRARHVELRRNAAEMGAEAARHALDAAGLTIDDIDCVIGASGTPDQAMPCNAALLLHALGRRGAATPAFDINASCLSFLVALDTIGYLVDAGRYRRVLIVSSDIASCGLDWNHLDASGIFGDGAAAAVIEHAGDTSSALIASAFSTFSDGAHLCEIKAGGSRFHPSRITEPFTPLTTFVMDGQGVFRMVGGRLRGFADELMRVSQRTMAEMAVVVPHQASAHALRFTRQRLRLQPDQMIDIYAEHGNQVGASLPSALHAAISTGRLQRGQHALLIGSGAGVSLGGTVLCY